MAITPSQILELTRAAFRQEADELLSELDTTLLQLEASPMDAALVNRAFRAIHTLKGSGATAGFDAVSGVLHGVEDALNEAREGRLAMNGEIVDIVLKVTDVVRRLLQGSGSDAALLEEGHASVRALAAHLPASGKVGSTPAAPAALAAPAKETTERGGSVHAVRFAPHRTIFHFGNDPLVMLRELAGLGAIVVRARVDALPALPELDPELCYLAFEAQVGTSRPEAQLREVFAFVEDDADVRITRTVAEHAWVLPPIAYFDPEAVADFVEEGEENIAALEAEVLALEENPSETQRVEVVFRALHNLKGQAGLLLSEMRLAPPVGYPLVAFRDLCHGVEGFAELHRGTARKELDEAGIQLLLQAVDSLKSLLADFLEARVAGDGAQRLLARLAQRGATVPPPEAGAHATMLGSVAAQCRGLVSSILRPGERVEGLSATEVKSIYRALQTLGRAASYDSKPVVRERADEMLSTCRDLQAREDGARTLSVLVPQYRGLEEALAQSSERSAARSSPPKARTISIRPSSPPKVSERAPAADVGAAAGGRSVRVDQHKLDRLMRAVGELLVARNSLPTFSKRLEAERSSVFRDVKDVGERISHIADDLQDSVMAIRMMPIRTMFQRFPRMIRDLARSEEKQVQLIISGEETELDKTVIEQLADPLVHLVRNAVDHGLEPPHERVAAGKPELGTVGLKVSQEGSFVVIEISDDGRGMRVEKLRDKAVEKGLLTRAAADALSREATFELVFLPGFSTAASVTSISGRGVGMDVVRNNVRQLHGTIAIESVVGGGSTFTVKLPASLMVSKAILVESSGDQFLFPIESVREMVKLDASEIHGIAAQRFIHIRGSVCPIVALSTILGQQERAATGGEQSAAIVRTRLGDVALIVDRLVAEIDVIVKPLSEGLDRLRMFQGASILGDGQVALVMDPSQLGAVAQAALSARLHA